MEELQDAIEDAQYVNAIVTQEDGPRPIVPWIVPTEEQLQEWRDFVWKQYHHENQQHQHQQQQDSNNNNSNQNNVQQQQQQPYHHHQVVEPFSLEWTCQSAIGFFLWSAYLKNERHDYLRINFIEQVLRWKRLRCCFTLDTTASGTPGGGLDGGGSSNDHHHRTEDGSTTATTASAAAATSVSGFGNKQRLEMARRLVMDYLQPLPAVVEMEKTTIASTTTIATTATTAMNNNPSSTVESSTSAPEDDEENNVTSAAPTTSGSAAKPPKKIYQFPPMLEIDEYDLERPIPAFLLNNSMTCEEFEQLYQDNVILPSDYSICAIGLTEHGSVREEILHQMQDMEQRRLEVRKQRQETRRKDSMTKSFTTTPTTIATTSPSQQQQPQQSQQQKQQLPTPSAVSPTVTDNRTTTLTSNSSTHQQQQKQQQHDDDDKDDFENGGGGASTRMGLLSKEDDDVDDDGGGGDMDDEDAASSVLTRTSSCSLTKQNQLLSLRLLMTGDPSNHNNSCNSISLSTHSNFNNSTAAGATTPTGRPTILSTTTALDISTTSVMMRHHYWFALPNDLFDKAEALVMESLKRQYWDDFCHSSSEYYTKLNMFLWNQHRPVVLEDFLVMRVLGRGGFGLVTACKKGTSGKLYAMKIMNKRRIKLKKSEQLALNERQVLAAVESPFVLNLKYSFHSKDDVYLILDLMTGGDLGYHLHQKGRFPKRESQYFAARILLGLQALHDKQYVYRDLKPENCLLADDGRVKITDLGLATKITPTLHGAAGTRGYWAPEMLRRDAKGKRMTYGHTVDWFSFGCCVAEFICGYNPFRSEAALKFGLERGHQTKDKAIDCAILEMDPVFDPVYFEPDVVDLCQKLLDKNEKNRLGSKGCEEIMCHPWFKNVNWEMIITDRKKPPFTPPQDVNAASQSEIGTFAEDKETVIDEKDEEVYKDWDWTNPRAFAAEVIEFLIYERETGEPLLPISQNPSCCCGIL